MDIKEWIALAFDKVQSTAFYETANLIQRQQIAQFSRKLWDSSKKKHPSVDPLKDIMLVLAGQKKDILDKWLADIHLDLYPKHVSSKNSTQYDNQIVSNKLTSVDLRVDRFAVFAHFPVELQIIDALWVILFGLNIDNRLCNECRGNRLASNQHFIHNRKWLYKRYIDQYKGWKNDCIEEVNRQLQASGEDVSIISLDLKDYYHSIRIDLREYRQLKPMVDQCEVDDDFAEAVKEVFEKMHRRYWDVASASSLSVFTKFPINRTGPLPIGLSSSPLLANDYLSLLDTHIKDSYGPVYYGRYVDDILIVKKKNLAEGVRDIGTLIHHLLPNLFDQDTEEQGSLHFASTGTEKLDRLLRPLCLQKDKVFVYNYDCTLPVPQIKKLQQDLLSRSSEFRLYSEEEDESFFSLDNLHIIDADLQTEQARGLFKVSSENKFQLSVYLTKSIQRMSVFGNEYIKNDEIENVHQLFCGKLIFDYYTLWERIFSFFIVAGRCDYAENLYKQIQKKIKETPLEDDLGGDFSAARIIYNTTILQHLQVSLQMAYSLRPDLLTKSSKADSKGVDLINRTYMARMTYNKWPLQNLMPQFQKKGIAMEKGDLQLSDWTQYTDYWMPFNMKWCDLALHHLIIEGSLDYQKVAKEYVQFNKLDETDEQKLHAYVLLRQATPNMVEYEYKAPKENCKQSNQGDIMVALANIELPECISELTMKDSISQEQIKKYVWILDDISRNGDVDVLILPELALPYALLQWYCHKMVREHVALISGLEYLPKDDVLHNKIISVIPMMLFGNQDAQIIVRDKNYYAPKEKKKIHELRYKCPDQQSPVYHLLHWKNHIFSTYYCYEITNIFDRSRFLGKVDAIYVPVFNKDTYYFSNIIESMTRDLSCYIIQCNVSKYGDTRITQPTKHYEMTPLSVKGGTDGNNKAVLLTGELDIMNLRDRQKEILIKGENIPDDYSLKPLPPQYTYNMVTERESGDYLLREEYSTTENDENPDIDEEIELPF